MPWLDWKHASADYHNNKPPQGEQIKSWSGVNEQSEEFKSNPKPKPVGEVAAQFE